MIVIKNSAQIVAHTNYWDTEHAAAGMFYLSWNAGAGRLLIPDAQKLALREMRGAKFVIVSRGPWVEHGGRDAIELLFEDGTDAPFCVQLVAEQCDRMIPDTDQGGGFAIALWTRAGLKGRFPGRYRVVDRIPCGDPWAEQ